MSKSILTTHTPSAYYGAFLFLTNLLFTNLDDMTENERTKLERDYLAKPEAPKACLARFP